MKARLPEGYGAKNPGNMNQMIKQAQKMQEDMQVKQLELDEKEFKATAGGGVVEVTMTGKKQLVNLVIKPEIVDPTDIDMLQDLVMAAVNEAIRVVEETTTAEMEAITGGINLPGLM